MRGDFETVLQMALVRRATAPALLYVPKRRLLHGLFIRLMLCVSTGNDTDVPVFELIKS